MVSSEKQQFLLKGSGSEMIKKCHCSRAIVFLLWITTLCRFKILNILIETNNYSLWLLMTRILKGCVIGSSLIFGSIGYFHFGKQLLPGIQELSVPTIPKLIQWSWHVESSFILCPFLFCLNLVHLRLSSDWNSSPKHTWVSLVQPWV